MLNLWRKIKEWFVGDGGFVHPLCATCNGCDCYKFPKCDHVLLNEHEFWSDSEWLDENESKYEPFIYESPDKGKTVYRRERGKDERELI